MKTNMNISRKKNLIKKFLGIGISDFTQRDIHSWDNTYKLRGRTDKQLREDLVKLEAKEVKFQAGKLPTDVWSKNNQECYKVRLF